MNDFGRGGDRRRMKGEREGRQRCGLDTKHRVSPADCFVQQHNDM